MTMNGGEQLKLWLDGTPTHNPDSDECCPDFSCCVPELLAPVEERFGFVQAWERGEVPIMESFLGAFKKRAEAFSAKQRALEVAAAPEEGMILKELPL